MFLAFFCLFTNGSLPNTFIEPFVVVSIPNSSFIVVDFPAPLFPIYPTISPSLILKFISFNACLTVFSVLKKPTLFFIM